MTTVDRIFQLIHENNLTAKEFARRVGVSQGNITDWKTGRAKPSVESLKKIANYANVQLEWLTGDSIYKTYKDEMQAFMENEKKSVIWNTINSYYYEYVVPCSITENNINVIIDIITNLTPENVNETKKKKKNFISSFPAEIQPKISKFIDIIIKAVIADLDGKNKFYYLSSLVEKEKKPNFVSIPIVGKIAAGQPILAEEYIEGYLPVDPNIYGVSTSEDLFYLRVAGQSMNLKVKNGDYALIKKQDYAEDGDIIVAIVNGDNEATLKRYKKLNDQFILLEPMSSDTSIEAITVDLKTTDFHIIGKAIGHFGKF